MEVEGVSLEITITQVHMGCVACGGRLNCTGMSVVEMRVVTYLSEGPSEFDAASTTGSDCGNGLSSLVSAWGKDVEVK